MLSIGAMGNGQGTYYVGLAREDYYLEGGEPPGQWIGQGSAALGLRGEVAREEFLNLFAGVDEHGVPLVQNAGDPKRQPGWDLTFSAPKSVSTLWAVTNGETRAAIQDAHFRAVKSALVTIEAGATTRRGHGGGIKEAAKLVIATFEHGTSRAQDPQLHTHALILNLAVRADGTTGTLESQHFYRSKMTVGALYRADLSQQLQGLGFEIERDGSSFRVAGVPEGLEKEFSKRRAEIEARLESSGKDSARAAAFAALDTREVKEHVAREALFESWRATGVQHGFSLAEAQNLQSERLELTPTERGKALGPMVESGIETLSHDHSHFGERELLRAVAEDAQGRGLGAEDIRAAVGREFRDNEALIALGEVKGEARYTTRELWETETTLLQSAQAWSRDKRHQVDQPQFLKGMLETERRATSKARQDDPSAPARELSEEQRAALSYLTKESGGVALLSGMAGTGKTFLLDAARQAWEAQGFTVKGTAVAGKAARGLQEGAGIQSTTVARLGWEWERGFDLAPSEKFARRVEWLHATWQIDNKTRRDLLSPLEVPKTHAGSAWQYATWQISKGQKELLDKQIERRQQFELNEKTVLVVDEAGMLGTRQMARLIQETQKQGAKLVLVGDSRQLQPIDVGGPFRALEGHLGRAGLSGIIRQKDEWARQSVLDFAGGEAHKALRAFEERGLLTIAPDRTAAQSALIEAWKTEGLQKPQENVIFAGTRAEVHDLNQRAQEARRGAGKLGFRATQVGGDTFYEKDRVVFTRNSQSLGVQNGSTGRVQGIDAAHKTLTVQLDGGEKVMVPYEAYQEISLGYALTTHKGQGLTTRNAFVLVGGRMADREISYVQASRATHQTALFTEKISVWNPETQQREEATLQELGRRMSQSRQKDIAHDVALDAPLDNARSARQPATKLGGEKSVVEREPLTQGF